MAHVSVIVPNYNHARYLPRRLDSILNQTFGDFELLILDDRSSDNSLEVIQPYLRDPRVRTLYNRSNSGNTYLQWKLGIDLTESKYIWIAESDDYADHTLLERLVGKLSLHSTAGMAVCESALVDGNDQFLGLYTDAFRAVGLFRSFDLPVIDANYLSDGREYCRQYMVPWNTIPNASAVVFRRAAIQAIAGPVTTLKLCGDWLTYCKLLLQFDIARIPDALNFFRTHANNVRSRTAPAHFLSEQREVRRYVGSALGVSESIRNRWSALKFEAELILSSERRAPSNKVPFYRAPAALASTVKYGLGLLACTLGLLAKEQLAHLLSELRLISGRT